jgi:hypothetical protein
LPQLGAGLSIKATQPWGQMGTTTVMVFVELWTKVVNHQNELSL